MSSANLLGSVAPANAATAIAQSLRDAILRGHLRSGEALPQDEIASRFGASKIPAREALVQLKAEGLVEFTHNKGAMVSALTAAGVGEIYDMRIALETLALRRAVPQLSRADAIRAESLITIMDDEHDALSWSALNWEFHHVLYAPCAMPRLMDTIRTLHTNVTRYHVVFLTGVDYHTKAQKQHRVILKSCKAGDAERAAGQLAEHLMQASRSISSFLHQQEAAQGAALRQPPANN